MSDSSTSEEGVDTEKRPADSNPVRKVWKCRTYGEWRKIVPRKESPDSSDSETEEQAGPSHGKKIGKKIDQKFTPKLTSRTNTQFVLEQPENIVAMGLAAGAIAGSSSKSMGKVTVLESRRVSPDCLFLPLAEDHTTTVSNNNESSSNSSNDRNGDWVYGWKDMYHELYDVRVYDKPHRDLKGVTDTSIASLQRWKKSSPEVVPSNELPCQNPVDVVAFKDTPCQSSDNSIEDPEVQEQVEYGIRQVGCRFFGRPFELELEAKNFEGRLIGFDKRSYAYIQVLNNEKLEREFKSMKEEMAEIFLDEKADYYRMKASNIQLNELLVAQIRPKTFVRVRVLAIRFGDNLILVVDVDDESLYEINPAQLYPIDRDFLVLPFLSIRCQLFGLEYLLETDSIGTVMPTLYGSPRMNITVIKKTIIPIVLMVSLDQKKSINKIVKKAISRFNPFPGHFEIGMEICNGKVVHADGEYIWYQIPTPILDFLTSLKPTKDVPENRTEMNWRLISDGVEKFVAPSKADPDKYVRIEIVPDISLSESDVKVMYTDLGTDAVISINDLVPFEYFDMILDEIPPQCVKFCTDPRNRLATEYLQKIELKNMNHDLHVCEVSKDGKPPKVECMIYFTDKNMPKVIKKLDKHPKGGSNGLKKLTFTDGKDIAIHKYDPISQKPMSQVTVRGFPYPFNTE